MKKTTLAIILALALTLSLGSVAFAEAPESNSNSTGTITFLNNEDDDPDEGIYDPDDLGIDELDSMRLDFGEVEFTKTAAGDKQIFKSLEAKRGDTNYPNYAGMVVLSRKTDWRVDVQIGGFTPGQFRTDGTFMPATTGIHGAGSVLQGFELALKPDTQKYTLGMLGYNFDGFTTADKIIKAADNGLAGDAETVAKGTGLAVIAPEVAPNRYGQNYAGELEVAFGATIPNGDAQAVMIWTYAPVVNP